MSLEYVTKISNARSLAIGEFAIRISIPVVQAKALHNGIGDGHLHFHIVVWFTANDSIFVIAIAAVAATETLRRGIQFREHEVAVALATPTPVDVEAAVSVITIADESVSSIAVGSTKVKWTSLSKFVVDKVVPLFITIVRCLDITCG